MKSVREMYRDAKEHVKDEKKLKEIKINIVKLFELTL